MAAKTWSRAQSKRRSARKPHAGPAADIDAIAQVVVDAALFGNRHAAQRAGVHQRTVEKWRASITKDAALAALVGEKKKRLEAEWSHGLAGAIQSAIQFLGRASNDADPKDPHAIHAVAGALKILAETVYMGRMLDARLQLIRPAAPALGDARPDAGADVTGTVVTDPGSDPSDPSGAVH